MKKSLWLVLVLGLAFAAQGCKWKKADKAGQNAYLNYL